MLAGVLRSPVGFERVDKGLVDHGVALRAPTSSRSAPSPGLAASMVPVWSPALKFCGSTHGLSALC
jgi:hypothetical protein